MRVSLSISRGSGLGRRIRFCAIIVAMALLQGCERNTDQVGQSAGTASRLEGKWLLINYWATWCKPCLEEIPQLNAFAEKYSGSARVLMVNYDGLQGEELRSTAEQFGIRTELAESDPAMELGLDAPLGLPTTYLIAPDGAVHEVLLGPQSVASLEQATGLGN